LNSLWVGCGSSETRVRLRYESRCLRRIGLSAFLCKDGIVQWTVSGGHLTRGSDQRTRAFLPTIWMTYQQVRSRLPRYTDLRFHVPVHRSAELGSRHIIYSNLSLFLNWILVRWPYYQEPGEGLGCEGTTCGKRVARTFIICVNMPSCEIP